MRKPKASENADSDLPAQNSASRALAAYQNTINQKNNPQPDADKDKETHTPHAGVEFIKTNAEINVPPGLRSRFNKTFERAEKEAHKTETGDSKYRRVAKLLILIGLEEASRILGHLDPEQVEAVSKEIASIRGVTPEEAASILVEFRSILSAEYKYSPKGANGGIDTARELLHAAFGKEKGETFLRKTVPESVNTNFTFLEKFTGEQLVMLFKDESVAAQALVLARLPPKLAADVINNSGAQRKIELIQRLSKMDKTSPEVIERVAKALETKLENIGDDINANAAYRIDGINVLTAILKASNPSFGDKILQQLGEEDPYLHSDLKEKLSTLDDVIKAEDRAIQGKLYEMTDAEIVLLIKSRSEEFVEKILSNVSAERRTVIRQEEEIMGPVRRRDIDKAAKDFLDWFREKREAGEMLLIDDDDIILD